MQKTVTLISLSLVIALVNSGHASSVRRVHRPWLMINRASSPVDSGRESVESLPVTAGNDLKKDNPGNQVAKQALHYKGTRYKFGGTTKKGLDCSGLVSRIYQDLQMKRIPRASASLYQSGTPVRLSELRPGDLVFFKNTYKRGISHVGVYAGSNRFVHAANHRKGVTVTSLADPYYQLHYAGARRLY